MKQKLLLLSSMVVVLMGGALMLSSSISPVDASQMMCTQEAKLCPDGVNYVSRTGPNCEFAACPSSAGTVCTQEAKLCPDGVNYVSRTGPNCEFAACPVTTGPACTEEYAPVCGQPLQTSPYEGIMAPQTYSNKCYLNAAGATYLYSGECKDFSTTTKYTVLTQLQISRLDEKLSNLVSVIEGRYPAVTQRLSIVEKMITIVEARPELKTVYKKADARQEAVTYILDYLKTYYSDLISTQSESGSQYAPD